MIFFSISRFWGQRVEADHNCIGKGGVKEGRVMPRPSSNPRRKKKQKQHVEQKAKNGKSGSIHEPLAKAAKEKRKEDTA